MNTEERLSRIESVIETLSNHVIHLDDVMTTLAEAQITLTRRVESIARESAEGDRRLGERIETLVSAIGEFIRSRPTSG